MDFVELEAFIGLLILAEVYKSHNETTQNSERANRSTYFPCRDVFETIQNYFQSLQI